MKIKEIEMAEVGEAVKLHNSTYNDKRTLKQWIWEYGSNYPELSVFTVVKNQDGKIVGTQGMIPVYININGDVFLSGKSESSLLHPSCRGKGLFGCLYSYAMSLCKEQNMSCVWGLTTAVRAVKVLRNKLGFSVFEDAIYESRLILNLSGSISPVQEPNTKLILKMKDSGMAFLLFANALVRRYTHRVRKQTLESVSIEEKPRSRDDISELYKRLRAEARNLIHLSLDEKYIAWRVLHNPNVRYLTFFAYKNNSLGAYCYVALRKREAYLADLTFEDYDGADLLLRRVIQLCRERNIRCLYFIGNIRNPLIAKIFDLLRRNGFSKRSRTTFVLKNISYSNPQFLNDIRNWYVNGLWTEGFRF